MKRQTQLFLSAAYPLLLLASDAFEEPPPAIRAAMWGIGLLGLIAALDEYLAG